jgi:hypothetical protein
MTLDFLVMSSSVLRFEAWSLLLKRRGQAECEPGVERPIRSSGFTQLEQKVSQTIRVGRKPLDE